MNIGKAKMKNLKTIILSLLLAIVILTVQSCFKDRENRHYRIPFKNDTNHSIYVFPETKEQFHMSPHFHDTILHSFYCDPSRDTINFKVRPREENEYAFFFMSCYEAMFGYDFDTLLAFVINADTLERYGWDDVCTYYKVEQRYDLSLENLQDLDFKLCFPPSEAMKHIHMWPPYGTYDENGNCRTIK